MKKCNQNLSLKNSKLKTISLTHLLIFLLPSLLFAWTQTDCLEEILNFYGQTLLGLLFPVIGGEIM